MENKYEDTPKTSTISQPQVVEVKESTGAKDRLNAMVSKADPNIHVAPSKLDEIPKEGTVQISGPNHDEEFEECGDDEEREYSFENEESDIHRMHMMQSL